jgi:hypothetical protein
MKERFLGFFVIGLLVGLFIGVQVMTDSYDEILAGYRELIATCQNDLYTEPTCEASAKGVLYALD